MQIYTRGDEVDYRTTVGAVRATWAVRGRHMRVMFLDDLARDEPARRWPSEPMPACRSGHIAFGPDPYPTLTQVRSWVPEYRSLWDAVEAEYRESLVPTGGAAAEQHARFFEVSA